MLPSMEFKIKSQQNVQNSETSEKLRQLSVIGKRLAESAKAAGDYYRIHGKPMPYQK